MLKLAILLLTLLVASPALAYWSHDPVFSWPHSHHWQELHAVPGQSGFGRFATGGRSRPLLPVTTLTDSISDGVCGAHCSLRDALDACKAAGGGRVVFSSLAAGGTLNLGGAGEPNINWDCDNSTIDGSTAPGRGIQIVGSPPAPGSSDIFIIDGADNFVMTNMRFRCTGYTGVPAAAGCVSVNRDIVAVRCGSHILFSHDSVAWVTDGLLDIGDGVTCSARDITIQDSLLAESINGFGNLVAGATNRVTLTRNFFASNGNRNVQFEADSLQVGVTTLNGEAIENFIFSFVYGMRSSTFFAGGRLNLDMRDNVFKIGGPPNTDTNEKLPIEFKNNENLGMTWMYHDRTLLVDGGFTWVAAYPGITGVACDPEAVQSANLPCGWPTTSNSLCDQPSEAPCFTRSNSPLVGITIPTLGITNVQSYVLANAGAILPCRDPLDAKVVADVGTGGPLFPILGPTIPLPDLSLACP